MTKGPTLLVIPNLRAVRDQRNQIRITRKFLEGAAAYADMWPGSVRVLMEVRDVPTTNLDEVAYQPDSWPFDLKVAPPAGTDADQALSEAAIVLVSIGFGHDDLPARCRRLSKPCLLVTEYTLRTRLQIAAAEEKRPLKRWRRSLWEIGQERRNIAAVRLASGVQANGTPTFDAYGPENPNILLYFDSRLTEQMLADEIRVRSRSTEGPLRLAFSGRFMRMKGVHHLVPIAEKLAHAGLEFQLDLFGDGPLAEEIRMEIERQGLSGRVVLGGVLDFASELIPMMSNNVELFVCPHLQGDPSCTYLETMGCGVPIVGYDNEAFVGIKRMSGIGWTTPYDDPDALANQILELARDRVALREAGVESLRFARAHTFERTFRRRIDHLEKTLAQHQIS